MAQQYLIIDEGNTRCKIALFQDDEVLWIKNLAQIEDFDPAACHPDQIMFCSVRRKTTPAFLVNAYPQIYHWSHDGTLPFPSAYKTPLTLGKDRIANVMALHFLTSEKSAKVAIDFGSCITVDIVNQEGLYTGGSISPGFTMQLKALHNYTGQLPLIEANQAQAKWGDSTESAIIAGVMNGINEMVNGFIRTIEKEHAQVAVYITGGEAKYFDFPNKNHIFANQNLTLIGLKEILKRT